jgi:hypothetical protein
VKVFHESALMELVDSAKLHKIRHFADITVAQHPLVKIRIKNRVPSIEEFSVFLECFGDIVKNTPVRIVLLFDLREGSCGVKTVLVHLPMLLLKLKHLRPRLESHLCCSSVIASNKETRDIVAKVPKSRPCKVYDDDKEAYKWMSKQLKQPQDQVTV